MSHDRMFGQGTRRAPILLQLLVIFIFALTADGQDRQYNIGSTVDLVSGSDSNPTNSLSSTLPQGTAGPASFFRLYPAISLATSGGRSALQASYALGLDGIRGNVDYKSLSHGVTLMFSYPANSRWRLNLNESFLATSDTASFNGLRSTTPPPDQFRFLFDPVGLGLSTRTNTAGISTDYTLNAKSTLSLSASHGLRNYGNNRTRNTSLSDQQFVTGKIDYTQKTTARDAWNVGYTLSYFAFQNFVNWASHSFRVGYSVGIARDVNLELTVGASRLDSVGSVSRVGAAGNYLGYNTSAVITRRKENDSFSVYYRQEAGQPTGLGSISQTRYAGVEVERRLGTIALFLDTSIFDAQERDTHLQTTGVHATASIGMPLTRTLSISGGAQYQRYDQAAPLSFEQQRFFVKLRYNDPKLWTIFR